MIPTVIHYCKIAPGRVVYDGEVRSAEEELDFNAFIKSLYKSCEIQYRKFYKMDDLSKLAFMTAEFLLRDHDLLEKYRSDEIAVVLANASSSFDTDRKYHQTMAEIPSPSLFVYTLPNIMVGEICIRHNFKGENAFFVSESFETDRMAAYVDTLLETSGTKACICGWIELEGEKYESMLYLVEKSNEGNEINLGPHKSEYLQRLYQNT